MQNRTAELARIVERVVEIGMRGGWKADLQLPTIQAELAAPSESASESPSTADLSTSLPSRSKLLRIIGEAPRSNSNRGAAGRIETSQEDKPS